MVICNKSKFCRIPRHDPLGCGGARPHDVCSECGHCPFDKSAVCVDVSQENTEHLFVTATV